MAREDPSVADVDLSRHAVIAASAGTGKTYSLEQLVLRLLIERKAQLDEILLVTYTEKAAGELKGRLRQRLETAQRDVPRHAAVLQTALDAFDRAHVYTIHGFCQRTLQEYAFEHREDFRQELAQDPDLLESAFRELQRKAWRAEYGERLADVLELAGYNGASGSENWERRVLNIAANFRKGCGHLLRPEALDGWPEILRELDVNLRADLERGRRLAGPLHIDRLHEHALYLGFGNLAFKADWRESRRNKLLLPLLQWLAGSGAENRPIVAFHRLLDACAGASSFDKHGFAMLTTQLPKKAQPQIDEFCTGLNELVEIVERRRCDLDVLRHQLAIRTVVQLQESLLAYKRERGLQSFEDMLTRVDDALDPDRNPHAGTLVAALRHRYQYAIVDEFQDTDPIQWRIFEHIFVAGEPEQRLFVVGDPKQAIFGFRGADLQTYLTATEELKSKYKAHDYPLDVNWRSSPELLGTLNRLFERGDWFAGTGITYRPVQTPPEKERRYQLVADHTDRKAVTLVDLSGPQRLTEAREEYARFMADEIARLLALPRGMPLLKFEKKGQEARLLQADDICVLVSKRKEAAALLAALRVRQIPYSFYKQPGLWQSDEAVHLSYLLSALARPTDLQAFRKALLTRFFRVRPEEMVQAEDLPPSHPAWELFQRWLGFVEEQNWAPFFQSIFEDTGLLHHNLHEADAERRLANCRHIMQTLEQAAYAENLDMLGVLDLLERMRRRRADSETDLQPIETEQPKVRIMTVHASKGLEFPVVFLAGGFTSGGTRNYLTYRDGSRLVFDLRSELESSKQACKVEEDAENRRLMYVALTRAMFKLYLPKVAGDTKKYRGRAGPLVTIVAQAVEKAALEELTGPPIGSVVVSAPPPKAASLSSQAAAAFTAKTPEAVFAALPDLLDQPDFDFFQRRIVIRSFSSLHRRSAAQASEGPSYAQRLPRADDDRQDALAGQDPLRGTVFGDLVHDVLEQIDFTSVGHAPDWQALLAEGSSTRRLLDEELAKHLPRFASRLSPEQLREASLHQVARLIWNALQTPLAALGVALWQVPPQDRLQELEFHFPEDEAPPPEVRREEGFLTGFMDLVFRREGKYFLADWKTNLLPDGYAPEQLAQSMRDCDYTRQYRLYLQALARWLRRALGGDFDPERDFGGVYYLFVRGMNGRDETTGVFFCRPTPEDLRLEQVLAI